MPVGTANKFSALMDDDDDDDSDAEDESPVLEEYPVPAPEISKAEAKKKGKKGGKKQDEAAEVDEPAVADIQEERSPTPEEVQKIERRAPAEKKKKPAVLGSNKF